MGAVRSSATFVAMTSVAVNTLAHLVRQEAAQPRH